MCVCVCVRVCVRINSCSTFHAAHRVVIVNSGVFCLIESPDAPHKMTGLQDIDIQKESHMYMRIQYIIYIYLTLLQLVICIYIIYFIICVNVTSEIREGCRAADVLG